MGDRKQLLQQAVGARFWLADEHRSVPHPDRVPSGATIRNGAPASCLALTPGARPAGESVRHGVPAVAKLNVPMESGNLKFNNKVCKIAPIFRVDSLECALIMRCSLVESALASCSLTSEQVCRRESVGAVRGCVQNAADGPEGPHVVAGVLPGRREERIAGAARHRQAFILTDA